MQVNRADSITLKKEDHSAYQPHASPPRWGNSLDPLPFLCCLSPIK